MVGIQGADTAFRRRADLGGGVEGISHRLGE